MFIPIEWLIIINVIWVQSLCSLDDMHRIDKINSLVTCPKNDVHHNIRLKLSIVR